MLTLYFNRNLFFLDSIFSMVNDYREEEKKKSVYEQQKKIPLMKFFYCLSQVNATE